VSFSLGSNRHKKATPHDVIALELNQDARCPGNHRRISGTAIPLLLAICCVYKQLDPGLCICANTSFPHNLSYDPSTTSATPPGLTHNPFDWSPVLGSRPEQRHALTRPDWHPLHSGSGPLGRSQSQATQNAVADPSGRAVTYSPGGLERAKSGSPEWPASAY
jgi:hypothetical protein